MAFGFLMLALLVFLVGRFFVGGSANPPFQALPWLSANPPLASPWREVVFFTVGLGTFWFVFVVVGAVLIAVGALQGKRKD